MADPITTLSLACSVFQTIDFASKFASTAWSIYTNGKHGAGDVDEVQTLRTLNTRLQGVLKDLCTPNPGSSGPANAVDQDIVELAKVCEGLVKELLESLDGLDLDVKGSLRSTLRATLKLKWRNDKIRDTQRQINDVRSGLTLALVATMRHVGTLHWPQQNETLKGLHAMLPMDSGANHRAYQRLGAEVINFVTSKLGDDTRNEERETLQTQILDAMTERPKDAIELEMGQNILVSPTVGKSVTQTFLSSLRFTKMKDREVQIPVAHQQTFRWIFNNDGDETGSWKDLKSFLIGEDKLYWVTGKAGSGKSTLMKYITRPAEQYLGSWSKERRLVIASFYFWNSGAEIQMNQEGLLMALLAQIFEQCPELVPIACPERWEALCLFEVGMNPWEKRDLEVALMRCVKYAEQLNTAIALFIDGLDEFEGKPEVLISFFQEIVQFPNVKCVVASRPWVEFEDAWRHQPSLRVEDLTRDDIKRYITSKFLAEDTFGLLQRREEDFANQLIENIVSKAAGVFLWVTLVVTDLIHGMRSGDRVSDLNVTLDQLPSELVKLYRDMLLKLKGKYFHHAAELFFLVKTSLEPMELLMAHYVDDGDVKSTLDPGTKAISEERGSSIMDAMERRINTRCRGMLEARNSDSVYHLPSSESRFWTGINRTVHYLHRTVKDYIEGPEAQRMLQPALDSKFDPNLRHLLGHVAYLKSVGWLLNPKPADLWDYHFSLCLQYAGRVSTGHAADMIALLDEVKTIGESLKFFGGNNWKYDENARASFFYKDNFPTISLMGPLRDPKFVPHFLSLAVQYGIHQYVRQKITHNGCVVELRFQTESDADKDPSESTGTMLWPLLLDAIFAYQHCNHFLAPPFTKNDMIKCLVQNSADPTHVAHTVGTTPIVYNEYESRSPLSRSICRLFIALKKSDFSTWDDRIVDKLHETHLLLRGGSVNKVSVDLALHEYLKRMQEGNAFSGYMRTGWLVRYRLRRQLLHSLRRFTKIDDLSAAMAASRGLKNEVISSHLTTLIKEILSARQKVDGYVEAHI